MRIIQSTPWNFLNEMNALLENSLHSRSHDEDNKVETSHWLPSVDVKETESEYLLYADLPGVDPKAITITMENNTLVLKGSHENLKADERKAYYRVERVKGDFYRRFTLPEDVDNEQIQATTKNGVLIISIPKKKTTSPRTIEIKSEN